MRTPKLYFDVRILRFSIIRDDGCFVLFNAPCNITWIQTENLAIRAALYIAAPYSHASSFSVCCTSNFGATAWSDTPFSTVVYFSI
jgi:hypothetical protein